MIYKTKFTTVLFGLMLLSSAAFAKQNHNSAVFLKHASINGMAEVNEAQLALQMAQNPDIQGFAKMILEDHTGANAGIKDMAKAKNVTLATDVTPKQKDTVKRLSKLNDRNRKFDREYLKVTISNHQAAIKSFEKQADHGTDADVRAFATQALPNLKKHLEQAISINARLNRKSEE